MEKLWKTRSRSKNFVKSTLVTSFVKTLIWRKKVHFSVKIVIAFYGTFPHCAQQCERYRIFMPLIFYVKSHPRIFSKNSVKNFYTVWKFQHFSVTKILREINFWSRQKYNHCFYRKNQSFFVKSTKEELISRKFLSLRSVITFYSAFSHSGTSRISKINFT